MELTSLRYFLAISREGSITAAARALGVSQPTLSVAVRNLEEKLHTRLLLRTHAGITLTATGVALARHAEDILAAVDTALFAVRDLQEDEVGRFTVACNASLGAYFFPGFLDRFFAASPAIELDLRTAGSVEVREAVLARTVHFGIVVNCEPHDDLVMTPLYRDVIELFAEPSRSLDARTTRSAWRESTQRFLGRAPLYWCDRPVFRGVLDAILATGLRPARVVPCGELELVKCLTLEGGCAGLLPGRVARQGHPGRLRPLSAELPKHVDSIFLIYRGDLPRTRASRRVREALLERGHELDLEGTGPA